MMPISGNAIGTSKWNRPSAPTVSPACERGRKKSGSGHPNMRALRVRVASRARSPSIAGGSTADRGPRQPDVCGDRGCAGSSASSRLDRFVSTSPIHRPRCASRRERACSNRIAAGGIAMRSKHRGRYRDVQRPPCLQHQNTVHLVRLPDDGWQRIIGVAQQPPEKRGGRGYTWVCVAMLWRPIPRRLRHME